MSAIKIIQAFAKKSLTKNQGSGITTLPSQFMAESKAGEIAARLQQAGIPINQLDDYIRSEADLLKFLNIIESTSKPRVIPGSSAEGKAITEKLFGKKGEVVEFPQKRSFKEEIDSMKKSGDIVDEKNLKKNNKVTEREMFKNSNLNKEGTIMDRITTASNRIKEIQKEQAAMYKPKVDTVTDTITYIKSLEPMTAMKEANLVIGRKGKYKNLTPEESKKILQDTEDHIFERDVVPDEFDPEYAKGGRISRGGGGTMGASDRGYQGGGRNSKGSVSGTAPGAAPGPGGDRDGPQEPPKVTNNPPPKSVSETVGIETVLENDINPNKFKNYLAANNKFNLQNYLDFQNQFNLLDTNKTYDEYIEMMDNDETLNPFQEDDMNKKSQEILQQFDFEKSLNNNPEIYIAPEKRRYRMAAKTGGIAGYYTGGMVDVEPNLSDIGHGSDALMARTRLVAPDSQATTSTGLNYLLAEDNDNIRVPFSAGGGGRRAFLKLLATLGGATAAAKSGILTLGGKEGTKKAITETVKQSAGGTYPPPYFFKLVEKIKFMGDDTLASKDKAIAKKYKDYVLEEDFAGNIEIIKKGDDVAEDVFMSLKVDEVPIKGKKGSTKVKEYEEYTATPDSEGKMKNIEQGVPERVIDEAGDTTAMTLKKADGGRIGFAGGGGKFLLSKLGINSTTTRFLEKVFGKEKYKNLIENDSEMHRGLLEVAEMFRKKDKEGLKMYMQKFLPHMDDEMVEDFIVGSGNTEGIEGQLIRLGSGRDYAGKLEMMQKLNNVKKLENLDVTDEMIRKPNSDGGRIGFSGGGILRAIIANSAKKKGMSVTDFIKATNYKGLPPEVKMFLSAEDFAKLKSGQKELYDNYIDMAKTRLEFQKNVEGGKSTPARELFEGMEKTMDEQSFVPKTVTSDDIAQMELMVKNRFNKGRKDNAQGGLQTMLGE